MIQTIDITVPAPRGEQQRKAYVYVPEGEGRFPVLYLFDGQTAFYDETAPFGESLRLGEVLERLGLKLIVAAVECDKEDRLTEYSPFPFVHRLGSSEGKGREHLVWLTETFKPMIDARFPTLSGREHTLLAGSSLGGLMALYGLAAFPNVFSCALAFSPSLWVEPQAMAELLKTVPKDCEVYFDYGEKELSNHAGGKQSLQLAEEALLASGASFTFRLAKGAAHNEGAWRSRLPSALMSFEVLKRFLS